MKKTIITTAVLAVFAVVMMATAQDPVEDEVTQLRVELADLGLRVARLEHAAGQTPAPVPGGSGDASAAAPVRTMVLVSISKSDHSGDHAEEIARLQRESSALMDTVNAAADDAAYDAGQQIYTAHVRGGVRGWGGGVATSNVGAVERQVIADHQVENRYATEHAIKKRRLEALQHADAESRQIIMGHDGNTIVSLETKHNLAEALNDIDIGDTVTWTGNRVSADDGSESWKISTIKKVQ